MKRPKFTKGQEEWLCEQIDIWYAIWKNKLTLNAQQPHHLGLAKEKLKMLVCEDENVDVS